MPDFLIVAARNRQWKKLKDSEVSCKMKGVKYFSDDTSRPLNQHTDLFGLWATTLGSQLEVRQTLNKGGPACATTYNVGLPCHFYTEVCKYEGYLFSGS